MTIMTALRRHAATSPRAPALSATKETVSWSELEALVSKIAEWLQHTRTRTLAFQLDNGIAWVAIDLAALEAGVDTIPIPTFFTEAQTDHILTDAAVDCFIGSGISPRSGWQGEDFPFLAGPECYRHKSVSRKGPASRGRKITYTSGSTGNPKGVCLEYPIIEKVAESLVQALAPIAIEKHLCVLPLSTLLENIAGVYAPIIKGIEIAVPRLSEIGLQGSSGLDIEMFASALTENDPHSIILVPELLLALTTLVQWEMVSPENLKMVAVGGGRVSRRLLETAEDLSIPVFEGYGLSECCSVLTLNTPAANKRGSVGKVLPHARLRISSTGEIEAQGSLMAGYLNDENLKGGWFPTGDQGRVDDDGFVWIDGRIKNVFVTAWGRNVNPEWVESELSQNPAIAHVLLVGEARKHNLALIWMRFDQSESDVACMVQAVNRRLPDYARIGGWIVMEEPMPETFVTANGKLRRVPVMDHYKKVIENHYAIKAEGESRVVL